MSKTKKSSATNGAGSKVTTSTTKGVRKPPAELISSVKDGRVNKSSSSSKAKSKEIAKKVASKHDQSGQKSARKSKSSKPAAQEPVDTSSESSSSEEESKIDLKSKVGSMNGKVEKHAGKPQPKPTDSSDEDDDNQEDASSDDSDDDDDSVQSDGSDSDVSGSSERAIEADQPKASVADASDSASSESDSSSSSDDDDFLHAPKEKADLGEKSQTNGVKAGKPVKEANMTSGSEESDEGSSDADTPSSEDEDKEMDDEDDVSSDGDSDDEDSIPGADDVAKGKEEKVPKKRKAEADEEPDTKKTKIEDDAGSDESKVLFVGNLSWNVDQEWLSRELQDQEGFVDCRVMADRDSGRSRGFGYADFASSADAKKALDALRGLEIDGRQINIDISNSRSNTTPAKNRTEERAKRFGDQRNPPSDTLFVGNVSFDATTDMLGEEFGNYGTITRVSLPTDQETGALKGFGYVGFSTIDEAQEAMNNLNGSNIAGRPMRLDFATARSNDGRTRGGPRGGGFGGRGGGRGGRGGGFGDRGGRGRGGGRGNAGGGRMNSTNRGGFGDYKGSKITF